MILGWMGYAILIGALVAVAAVFLEWSLRAYRSETRWIWVAALMLTVLGPLAVFGAGGTTGSAESQAENRDAGPTEVSPFQTVPSAVLRLDDSASLSRLDRPIVAGWLIATMLLAARYGVSLAALARRRRAWRTDDVDGIPVRFAPDLGPAAVGFLSPAIVLPEWIRLLDRRLLRLVVAHEQEHVHTGDTRLMIAVGLLVVLLPWNLPLWWQIRRLRLAVEIDCDRRVLARNAELAPYLNVLCEIGSMRGRSRVDSILLGQSALIRPAAFLERRIRHMTAPVPRHRSWKTLGVGIVAIALLGSATLPDPPPAHVSDVQQEYALLVTEIEYRDAQSIAELPSYGVIRPAQPGIPERRWRETYEAYEDMAIVDRVIITREEVCYTTREPDGSMTMRTHSTVPEIDSLSSIPNATGAAVSRFLSMQNGGKEVNYMAFTVEEEAVCFLLQGDMGVSERDAGLTNPPGESYGATSEDSEGAVSSDSEGSASPDTIDFEFTSFTEHPVCLEVCAIQPFFETRVGSTSCNVIVGIHIDERGRVDAVDVLKRSAVPGCNEAAEAWARSTRWSPARNPGGRIVPAWIAQPLSYEPMREA
ncbi:MAG TPA: M56 family metallopeptidase [Gemmatimonadota bacterium]|nr:M56 family metallopeptidase [Gemmatimonadota bacterium]